MVEHWDEAGAEDGSEETAIEEKPPGAVYLTCCVTGCGVEVRDESRAEDDTDHSEDADDDVEEVGHDDVADDTTEVASADELSPGTDRIEASYVGGEDSFPATATAGEPSSSAARMAAGRMARRNLEGCNQKRLSWRLGLSYPITSGNECRFIDGGISVPGNLRSLRCLAAVSLGVPFLTITVAIFNRRRSSCHGHCSWGIFSLGRAGCRGCLDGMMAAGLDIMVSLREVAMEIWNNGHDSSRR